MKFKEFQEFKEFQVCNTMEIKGGECTGGGFKRVGNIGFEQWDADETNACGTSYTNMRFIYNCQ